MGKNSSLNVDSKNPSQSLQQTPITSDNDVSVRLAICLSGIQCETEQVCLIAQESCIGARAFKAFDKNTRIAISECQVNSYLCILERSKNCETTNANCVSKIVEKVKKIAINTYEKVIEK